MAQLVKKIRTEAGDLQIDYNALANLPSYLDGGAAHVEEKSTAGTRYVKIIDAQCKSAYHRICQSMIVTSRMEAFILTIVLCSGSEAKFDTYNAYYVPLTSDYDYNLINYFSAGIVNTSGSSNKFELWFSQGQWQSSINITPLSKNYEGFEVDFYNCDSTTAASSTKPTFDLDIPLVNSVGQ